MTYAPTTTNLVVNLTSDSGDGVCDATCTLRDAITTANSTPGIKNITFNLPSCNSGSPCTITLSNGELTVANNGVVKLTGPGTNVLSVSGNNQSRIFRVSPNASMNASGLTFTGASPATVQTAERRTMDLRWIAWRQRSKRRRDLQRRLACADRLHRYL